MLANALLCATPASAITENPIGNQVVTTAPPFAFDLFLDRLMAAESGGRRNAKNPRSTALGPYQFIKSTFLELTRRHFPAEIAGLSEAEILGLRTDPELSRRAAAIFCKESVSYLTDQGLEPTFAHLRLAYLLGPADAARVMQAPEQTPVAKLLSAAVIKANPFMRGMSATDLLAKSERDVTRERREVVASVPQANVRPAARARPAAISRPIAHADGSGQKQCNPGRASCRKFLALPKDKAGSSKPRTAEHRAGSRR